VVLSHHSEKKKEGFAQVEKEGFLPLIGAGWLWLARSLSKFRYWVGSLSELHFTLWCVVPACVSV
jgi:hypothetical protein